MYMLNISRCSAYLAQLKTKYFLDSTASPHSQRFNPTALMLCKHLFSRVMLSEVNGSVFSGFGVKTKPFVEPDEPK
jgi:hypothetical protein